jgi:hypothetical protein
LSIVFSAGIVLSNGYEAELSEANGWTFKFDKLFLNEDGKEIEYSITEKDVEGYEASITGDYKTKFVVTNKIIPTGDEGEPEDPANPHTADHLDSYITMLFVSVSQMLVIGYHFVKFN